MEGKPESLETPNTPERGSATLAMLRGALRRARGSLLWERLWPALAALATAFGLFLAFSWAGLWIALPPLGRIIGLFIFALVTAVAVVPLLLLRMPSVYDGLRRLDRNSGATHRPATTLADEIAANNADPVAQALWRAHVERALLSARRLKAGWPAPRLALRDPMAFRALVLILVIASFFAASGDRSRRLSAAFDWQGVIAPANFRIDAWVTPPPYTGRAPVILPGLRPGESAQAGGTFAVPAGSTLVVRATGKPRFEVVRSGGIEDAPAAGASPLPSGAEERRFIIKSDGSAIIRGASAKDMNWIFTALPDKPPIISLIRDPERQARGALRLDYRVEDDYGVTDARATFERKPESGERLGRPLYDAPSFGLSLPAARARNGIAQTTHDLTEHPWAGANVILTLVARDEAKNEGRSDPQEMTLPERIFVKPLARALVEQRRILALDGDAKKIVLAALDALTIAPERFTPEVGIYLGLRSLYFDLTNARNDDALRDVVSRMWQMAVQIEDGNISDAEQRLRQAQEALRQALERGASDEELKKLMDELRAALDKFLQALMEEMRKNPQQLARPLDQNTRMLDQRDLKSMIDRMEQLARSGNKDAARRLLEELQQMLENLQTAQPGQQGDDGDDDMAALDELADMIRKQQQLRDRTFKEGQEQRRDRQRGQRGERQMGDLQQDQQQLKDRLNKLLEQLKQRGMGQQQQQQQGQRGEKGQRGEGNQGMDQLGDAGEAMGEAEGQLGGGDADGAVDSQGRALEAMRKGAQGMAQAMQQG
ncbi:MAG: TIGR02302 family protein, partial [Pseudolabrys sp.]|nr:TIGR02302 family protein [Pseudolabrys sp.]